MSQPEPSCRDLADENARLREQLHEDALVETENTSLREQVDWLKSVNAGLRRRLEAARRRLSEPQDNPNELTAAEVVADAERSWLASTAAVVHGPGRLEDA